MARFLAVDWDHSEVRYLCGTYAGDQLILLKSGSAPLFSPPDEPSPEPDEAEGPPAGGAEMPEDPRPAAKKASPARGKDPESLRRGEILKRLLRRDAVPSAPLLLCIPRDRAELLNLALPRLSEAELPDIVKNQLLRDAASYAEGDSVDFIPLAGQTDSAPGKIFSASISRAELRNLRAFCAAAGRKAARIELRLTALAEFVRAGCLGAEEEVLLVQEGTGEVNFALFRGGQPVYFRTVQVDPALSGPDREKRLAAEIIRTGQIAAGEDPVVSVLLFGGEGDYAELAEELQKAGIQVETADPFTLPGITARLESPPPAALYAPLVGALLAEREKKSRPILDFLHPRQKPKPPNYALPFVLFLLALCAVFAYLWHWNKKDLLRRGGEIARMAQNLSGLQSQYAQIQPQFDVLDGALAWDRAGVNVLDTLRDILFRLPPAPDMLVSRMAYNQFDPAYNAPVFILSAKITEPQVFSRFLRNMTSDNAYQVNSPGPVQSPTATDDGQAERQTEFNFTAVILCARRAPESYLEKLPPELREISNRKPEYFDRRPGGLPESEPAEDRPSDGEEVRP